MDNNEELDFTQIKLTEWANEPSVSDLKKDAEEARGDHDTHVTNVSTWLDNLNGVQAGLDKLPKNRSRVVPKLIRKQAEWRYAALSEPFLSTEDVFNVEPVTYEDKPAAEQNSLILNNQFNTKLDKVNFIDEYVRTAVDEGTVIVRVGWEYEDEIEEIEVPKYMAGATGEQILIGTETVEQTNVLKNQPTLEVCDYRNVIIDPTCKGDLNKAEFIIYSFETSFSELQKDGRYKNLDNINADDNNPLNDPDHSPSTTNFRFKDNPRKKLIAFEYWGYWDIDGSGIVKPIVATYVGNTMIRLEENPFPDQKLPFVLVQYLPVRKAIYGEPDGHLLEDNQKVVGAVTRGMIDIMGRSANSQIGYRKGTLDITNKRKFELGLDYEYNNNVSDPRQAFHMGTFPEIPRSAMEMIQLQNTDAESLTGVKAFSSGLSGQALGSTATGIRSALDATSKRELGILRRLARGMEEIGRKIISMNAEFLSEEEIVRVTNEDFVTIRRDDLRGELDLRLTISTAETDNEKAQELSFMLQTGQQSMDPGEVRIIRAEIAKLRKMPALAKRIEEYQPEPDPLAVQEAQLKIALLEAQIQNERNKALENQADIGLKEAKTETELAKGRNLHSKSDQQDLDFLEKESGMDHAKEMEKREFDRGANLDLKAAEKLFGEPKA